MINLNKCENEDPFSDPLEALLADIAINLQLPPGLHGLAIDRYEAIRDYAEREGSPLEDKILRFYAQGSMAIDATISTRGTDDEYDLDIVAELNIAPDTPPHEALDLLARSLAGYPVARKVERQTRCITIRYADKMHVDVTPASRLPAGNERDSHIFHAKEGEPASKHLHVPMNAWGFGHWYGLQTPIEPDFAKSFRQRLIEARGGTITETADVDDVPEQTPFYVKNRATVALQLIKRMRNIQYADFSGRMPPSVMISCFAGNVAQVGTPLSDILIAICREMIRAIKEASDFRRKLMVVNPAFARDCFTDRWPETIGEQDRFAKLLRDFVADLVRLKQGNVPLEEAQRILKGWFGEGVVSRSVMMLNERLGRGAKGGGRSFNPGGRIIIPGRTTAPATGLAAAAGHTFHGILRGPAR